VRTLAEKQAAEVHSGEWRVWHACLVPPEKAALVEHRQVLLGTAETWYQSHSIMVTTDGYDHAIHQDQDKKTDDSAHTPHGLACSGHEIYFIKLKQHCAQKLFTLGLRVGFSGSGRVLVSRTRVSRAH
jgi:hypothetical protein